MDFKEIRWGSVDWIYVAEDRDQWRAAENCQWTCGLHKMRGISRLATELLAYQALCSLESSLITWMVTVVFTLIHRTVATRPSPVCLTKLHTNPLHLQAGSHRLTMLRRNALPARCLLPLHVPRDGSHEPSSPANCSWFILVSTSPPQHPSCI
jgi:hypothetical protein